MTPLPTLAAFAEQVARQPDEPWLPDFCRIVQLCLPDHPPVALLHVEEEALRPLASSGEEGLPLPTALPETLPQRTEKGLLLALPAVATGALWVGTRQPAPEVEATLAGWLAVAGLALHRQVQGQEAEKQRTARDHFFSMVNHDLKSPLASIKAMSDLIVRKMARGTLDPSSEEGKGELAERLNFLSQRVKDLALLIDEIGEVSNIERGRLELHLMRTEVGSVVRASVERLQERYGRAVQVEGGAEALMVQADAQRLAQICHHLLKNAILYSQPDSPIVVHLAARDGQARVQVVDKGAGIPPEQAAKLFHEYGRAVQTSPSGLGVGLYVAAALARTHGGTLSLESKVGNGTTLTLALPLL